MLELKGFCSALEDSVAAESKQTQSQLTSCSTTSEFTPRDRLSLQKD